MPFLPVFPLQKQRMCKYRGFSKQTIKLRVDRELEKSGYQKNSEPISVHFCEVYQSHIRWWGYRKTDPEQQKTVPTPKGYKNLTFTPGLLQLFMVYGADEGNRTPDASLGSSSFTIKLHPQVIGGIWPPVMVVIHSAQMCSSGIW